jgi:hypothetical protein
MLETPIDRYPSAYHENARTSHFDASEIYKEKENETSSFFFRRLSSGSRSRSYIWDYGSCLFGNRLGAKKMRWSDRLMRDR